MSTNVTWNGTTYSIPAGGEVGWSALSSFLIALGNNAAIAEEMKQAVRVATTSPVTVSDTTDCVIVTNLSVAGPVTVNLPSGTTGRIFMVVDGKGDAATNNVTIDASGAETINGAATYVISDNRGGVVLGWNGTGWTVLARYVAGIILVNPMATTGDMIYGGASGIATNLATGATAGVLHGGNGSVPSWAQIVNADVSASAAIEGSKLVAATNSVAGAVTASAQSFAGLKTFYDGVKLDDDANEGGRSTLAYYAEANDSPTFTFNGSGGTSGTVTLRITRIGRNVTIWIPTITATTGTGSTQFTATSALPTWAWPTAGVFIFAPIIRNNGVAQGNAGLIGITSAGIITIYRDAAGTAWTNSAANSGTDAPTAVSYLIY